MKIFITGSYSGLGYQYAKALSKRGHIVYCGVRTEKQKENLEEKSREDHIILFPIKIELEEEKTYPSFEQLDIDCLILQASIGEGGSVLELKMERLEKNYKINVFANFSLIQKYLLFCYQKKKRGKIFLTSSLAAFLPLPYLASYTSTKISLYQIAKTLYYETKYQNLPIDVSVILPGSYHTGFNQLMVENKEKDDFYLPQKAKKMTIYQNIFFALTEKKKYTSMVDKVIKEVEKTSPSFLISAPIFQRIFVKFYLISSFLFSL